MIIIILNEWKLFFRNRLFIYTTVLFLLSLIMVVSLGVYQNEKQKDLIENSIKEIEKKFKKKVVTYVREFEKFYKAEAFHQNYYQINFVNYLRYKKACRREATLNNIWGS